MKYKVIIRPEAEDDLKEENIIILAVIHGKRRHGLIKKRIDGVYHSLAMALHNYILKLRF